MMNPNIQNELINSLTLKAMTIIACIVIITGIILMCSSNIRKFLIKHKILKPDESHTKPKAVESELNNMSILTIQPSTEKEENVSSETRIIQIVCFIMGLMIVFNIAYLDTKAKKYGAYDNYYATESIKSIIHNINNGFEDDSAKLPSELKGSIIIYYKYGCEDCALIHDDLISFIEENSTENIYFVSTRSETGKSLSELHEITEVPSAVYIFNKETNNMTFAKVLLYEPTNKDTDKSVFIEDNMAQLIALQKEGI